MLSVLCQFTATVASGNFILQGEDPTYYRENINIQGISIRVRKGLLSITASWVEWKKGKKKRAWRDEAKHRWYHEWGSGETQPNQEKHIFKENIMPIVVKLSLQSYCMSFWISMQNWNISTNSKTRKSFRFLLEFAYK